MTLVALFSQPSRSAFKKTWRRFTCLGLFLFCPKIPVHAQFTHFTPEDGLPQSTVLGIHQDKQGLLWISTGGGVSRYDGSGFTDVVPKVNATAKTMAAQGRIHSDANGDIWIGGVPGLYRYEPEAGGFRNMLDLIDSRGLFNTSVYGGYENRIWYSGKSWTVTGYDLKTGKKSELFFSNSLKKSEGIVQFVMTEKRYLLITTQGVHIYSRDNMKEVGVVMTNAMGRNICEIKPGLWVFYFHGHKPVYYSEAKDKILTEAIPVLDRIEDVDYLLKTKEGVFIASHGEGLFMYNNDCDKLLRWYPNTENKPGALGNFTITSMFLDRGNQLWVGTDGGGIYKLNLKPTTFGYSNGNPRASQGEENNFVRAFLEDKYGRLWVGIYNGGLSIFNSDFALKMRGEDKFHQLANASVTGLYKDKSSRIWIATDKGIFETNDDLGFLTNHKIVYNWTGPKPSCNTFLETRDGRLLCATTQGLFEFNSKTGQWNIFMSPGSNILTFYQDDVGRTWLSLYWSSLHVFPGVPEKYDDSRRKDLYASLNVRNIVFDRNRKHYILATENGLKILDSELREIEKFEVKDGLSNSFVYGTLIDGKGNYWVSTNDGISVIMPDIGKIYRYGVTDGLQSKEFNTSAHYMMKNGTMVFGGIQGFNYFKPEVILSDKQKEEVVLTEAWITNTSGERHLFKNTTFEVLPGSNLLDIAFALPDYTNPGAIKYYYNFNGKTWISLGNKNRITLSDLSPGKYDLHVKATDHRGIKLSEKVLMHFTVPMPFYRQWWFLILILFASGALVFWITRYLYMQRVRIALGEANRIKEIHSLRMNISRELHDNLGANLSRVSLLSYKLRDMPDKTDVQGAVSSIAQLALEMNGQVRNIVWSIDNSYDNLGSLQTYIRQFASTFLEENDLEYEIKFSDRMPDLVLSPDVRQALFSVIKEGLNNAVKYSQSKKMELRFEVGEKGNFELVICDFGIGFDPAVHKPFSHGLRNIRERLTELGFTCDIDTSPGKGCKIMVSGKFNIPHK